MVKQRKYTKILTIIVILLALLCVFNIPSIVKVGGKKQHYEGSYHVIQKDLESDSDVAYAISDGLVNPFYKNQYYFELSFNFDYKIPKSSVYKVIKNKKKECISINDFDDNSQFIVNLYDYKNNQRIKQINIFPILKRELKELYFLDGFSDAYLSKEGKDLIFNLPINQSCVNKKSLKNIKQLDGKYNKMILKINLMNQKTDILIDKIKESNVTNKSGNYLSDLLINAFDEYDIGYRSYLNDKNKVVKANYFKYNCKNSKGSTIVVLNMIAFYKDKIISEKYFRKFPKLEKYIEDNQNGNKLLVFYFKEKNTKLEKEIMNINK